MQFFPNAQTLVAQHLHKVVEPPVIIHHAAAPLLLASVFGVSLREDVYVILAPAHLND